MSGGSQSRNGAARAESGTKSRGKTRGGVWETAASGGKSNGRRQGAAQVFGALDLGTNNCRLLVAKPAERGYRVVDTFSRVVRLGEGLSQSDILSEAAMERTFRALRICAKKMRRLGVTQARCVATDACRRASNYPAFRARVEAEFGLKLELISSQEETRLAVYGCAPLFDPKVETALVFDIGGGSTEICWVQLPAQKSRSEGRPVLAGACSEGNPPPLKGLKWHGDLPGALGDCASIEGIRASHEADSLEHPKVLAWKSLPMGVTNLAERYGGGDISPACYDDMVSDVLELLEPFEKTHGIGNSIDGRQVQMLGTSGTVTTLVGVKKDLARYDRRRVDGSYLTREAVEGLNRRLAGMSYDERVAHPCIGRQRADLVVAGCAILDALCRTWPVERLRVADRGLREGIIFALMRGL